MNTDQNTYGIRGIQLDLARQMEPLPRIFEFIDLAAEHHFNMLMLYLEGRIRTAVFPYLQEGEFYTESDIRRIVAYASQKGLTTVPVIAVLGHCELFLECPQLAHLAELRDGMHGRYFDRKTMVCPSNPDTFTFFARYLREVSGLFPGKYMHLGFDECWDLGTCPDCAAAAKGKMRGGLFIDWLLKWHAFVTRELKKEMMIWDDMFDFYPETLELVPRDVMLCAWNYARRIDEAPKDRLGCFSDRFARFDELGFRYLVCPSLSGYFSNTRSFTEYAAHRHPAGGVLTIWERAERFLADGYPAIAYAGELWRTGLGNDGGLRTEVLREFFPEATPAQIQALQLYYELEPVALSADWTRYLAGGLTQHEAERAASLELLRDILAGIPAEGSSAEILEELLELTDMQRLFFKLRSLAAGSAAEEECIRMIQELQTRRAAMWQRARPGIAPCKTDRFFEGMLKVPGEITRSARDAKGFLIVKTPFGISKSISFAITFAGHGEAYTPANNACFYNPPFEFDPLVSPVPLAETGVPESVEITIQGAWSARISFFEIVTGGARYAPSSVEILEGTALCPERLLVNDWLYGEIGRIERLSPVERDNPAEMSRERTRVRFAMKKVDY